MKGKMLIIRGGAIGDFILTLPVLSALRKHFPETRLEVMGYAHIAGLAMAGGLADAVKSIDSRALAGFFAPGTILEPELCDYFSGFNVILSYLYDPDRIFQQNLTRCTGAQFIAGPHRPSETQEFHATATLLEPLERLAIFEADPVPRLCLPQETVQPKTGRPVLALHPGSGSEKKNWPEILWLGLIERLVEGTHFDFLLVGGEAEGDRLERLAARMPPERTLVARSLPLTKLAERLAGCDAFVGHDSGITHLAAALGLTGLVLWGPSAERVWRPLGERIRLLRAPGELRTIPVDQVFLVVSSLAGPPG